MYTLESHKLEPFGSQSDSNFRNVLISESFFIICTYIEEITNFIKIETKNAILTKKSFIHNHFLFLAYSS